jgi:hypothetical protein
MPTSTEERITYTPVLDKKPSIWKIPQGTFVIGCVVGMALATLWIILATVGFAPPLWIPGSIWLTLCVVYWALLEDQPWRIQGQLHRRRPRENKHSTAVKRPINTLKPKLKTKRVGPKSAKRKVRPAEEDLDIASVLEFQIDGNIVGAVLLQRGERLQVVWFWSSSGIPSTTTQVQAKVIAERIQEGLRDLRMREPLTMHMGSFSDCSDRVAELNRQGEEAPLKESTFLLSWMRKRVKALKRLGRYNPKFLRFYIAHELGAFGRHEDWFSGLMQMTEDKVQEWRGKKSPLKDRLHMLLVEAFEDSFYQNQNLFRKCGIPANTASAEQVWEWTYRRFNQGAVPPIPQLIVVTRDGLQAKQYNKRSIASVLLKQCPDYGKDCVWLPGRRQFAGGVVLEGRPNRSYDPQTERLDQLLDASSPILGDKSQKTSDTALHDLEIVCTLTPEHQKDVLLDSQKNTGQSNQSLVMTEDRKRLDGGAIFNTRESLGAEMKLRSGGHTVRIGWMAIAYRPSRRTLDRALEKIESLPIFSGGKVTRETGYFDSLFLEAMPLTLEPLLSGDPLKMTERFDRRIRETTAAAVGLMPLILDSRPDQQGVEFITRSGSPMLVDPMGRFPHNHMIVVARTRAGKSVLVQQFASNVLVRPNCQVIIIDAGREDGSGSFDEFTEFTDSSHFREGKDSYNIFQIPDRATLPSEKYEIASTTYQKFILSALVTLTTSLDDPARLIGFYQDILTNLITTFLADPSIQEKYKQAYQDGFGSQAWQQMPCLETFVAHMSLSKLPAELQNEDAEKAIQRMRMSLIALMQRQAGQALSRPSTFRTDKPLVVYALGGVQNNADMVPALLAASASMLAQTFTRKKTFVVAEEATHLWQFLSYRMIVTEWFTGKAKSGVWVCWVGQSLDILLQHKEANSVLENVGTTLVGWIRKRALEPLAKAGLDPELVSPCIDSGFNPPQDCNNCEYATQWLIETDGRYHFGYNYNDFASLGITMNSLEDVLLREQVYTQVNTDDKYERVAAIAAHLEQTSIDRQGFGS